MPGPGIEPGRPRGRQILSLLRLPVPPSGLERVRSLRDGGARAERGRSRRQRKSPTFRSGFRSFWRPGSELNRRTRICSPLHNHSATRPVTGIRGTWIGSGILSYSKPVHARGPETTRPRERGLVRNWSGKRDSNSRPRPWQGRALPTELFPLRNRHFRHGMKSVNTFFTPWEIPSADFPNHRPGCQLPVESSNASAFAMRIFSMNARLRATPATLHEGTQDPTTASAMQQPRAAIRRSRKYSVRRTAPDKAGTRAPPSARSS